MKKIISSVLVIILMFSLALTCLAADTTPSVEAKPAPELTPIDPENPDVVAQIKTSSDTKDVFKGALSIISLADKDTAPEDVKNNLTKTFDDINEGKIDKVIAKAAKAINKDYTSNNLIATDLFELSLSAEAQAELKNSDGGYISVKFKVAKAPAAVLHLNTKTNEWIVDGFHRWRVMKDYRDIYERENGMLPVSVIDKPISNRMASTVRHNRARGNHDVDLMSNIVKELHEIGRSDAWISKHLGMDKDELLRLKQITGLAALFRDVNFGKAWQPIDDSFDEDGENFEEEYDSDNSALVKL